MSYRSPLDPCEVGPASGRDGAGEAPAVPGAPSAREAAVSGDPSAREAMRRGLALVRGYARGDADAVAAALDGTDRATVRHLPSVTGDILRLVVGIVTSGPRTLTPADVAGAADGIAAAGPPHHELAVTQAVRAWAAGDAGHLRQGWRDGTAAAHGAAVLAAALAERAWGSGPFLGLLETFDEVLDACG